jgi:hypothetical protein
MYPKGGLRGGDKESDLPEGKVALASAEGGT